MQPRSLEERVTMLERQMLETRDLPQGATKLELQIVQHRQEIRDEFSAIRSEMRTGDDNTRVFMRVLYEDVLSRLQAIGESYDSDGSDQ